MGTAEILTNIYLQNNMAIQVFYLASNTVIQVFHLPLREAHHPPWAYPTYTLLCACLLVCVHGCMCVRVC